MMTKCDTKTVVFFDGSCPLCQAEIDYYRTRDTSQVLHLVDVAASQATMPPGLTHERAMARFHVLSSNGRLLSGAMAFAEVWKQLPGWRHAGRLVSLPGIMWLAEIGYRCFLLLRPAFVRVFLLALRLRGAAPASAAKARGSQHAE